MNTNRYFFNKLSLSIFILMQCYLLPLSAQSVTDTITILSFNDFHGAFTEDENVSGAAVFSQALIDAKNSHPHPIVVSAGDNFSGSYFSRITRGEPIQTLFDSLNVEVSAIGNHEFDWGVSFLRDTASKWMDYVA
ncbi:MAG: 2',3'-cyclic-nucleotide 2'-phosphodiesterase, partial [Bacteroidales bacterium]